MPSNTIHPLSQDCALSQFDIFSVPPTQRCSKRTFEDEHRPVNFQRGPLNCPIEFELNTDAQHYIIPSDLYLKVHLKVKLVNKDGTDLAKDDAAATTAYSTFMPANYLLNTLWRQVEVTIGDSYSVSDIPGLYPYRAYLEALLSNDETAKATHLALAGWEETESKRSSWVRSSLSQPKDLHLNGRLHMDLSQSPKALLGNTKLKLKLTPATPEFYMMTPGNYRAKVEIEDIRLRVTYHEATPELVNSHNVVLNKTEARYPLVQVEMLQKNVPAGSRDANFNRLFTGETPSRTLAVIIDNSILNGQQDKDPFKFENAGVEYAAMKTSRGTVPHLPYKPSWDDNLYHDEYLALFKSFQQNCNDPTLLMKYAEFKKTPIFAFDFAPDINTGCHTNGYVSPPMTGAVDFQIEFKTANSNVKSILFYSEYPRVLCMDAERQAFECKAD